jgi:ribulose kinase
LALVALACIIDLIGDIRALAAENNRLWQLEIGRCVSIPVSFTEAKTTIASPLQKLSRNNSRQIFGDISVWVQRALSEHDIDPSTVRGINFDAPCSLAVFLHDTGEPMPVTGPSFSND